jgi:iron complex transport system substrate-binding protein
VKAARVVSLLPGATEIVCFLGRGEHLVGRSHECDFPEDIRRLPACTSSRLDPRATSGKIEAQVAALRQGSQSLYEVDARRLRELKPDLILTQAQCDVCAVSPADVEAALAGWRGRRPEILTLAPRRLPDVWEDIRRVAVALGIEAEGRERLRRLKLRCVDVIEKACLLKRRPSLACLEWLDPLMAAGNWVPELVELAGGANLFGTAGEHSPWLKWDAVREQDPELLLLMPCGFDIARTLEEMAVLRRLPDWERLRAVRGGRVYVTDGSRFFNRPGPRLVESLEILAEILHPELFDPRHQGDAWQVVAPA